MSSSNIPAWIRRLPSWLRRVLGIILFVPIWILDQMASLIYGTVSLALLTAFAVGLLFLWIILTKPSSDTTYITNIAFAIVAPISAISFSAVRALPDSDRHKDAFQYAGERCLHAAVMLLLGSIIKCGVLFLNNELKTGGLAEKLVATFNLKFILNFDIAVLFLCALYATYKGLGVLNEALISRDVMPLLLKSKKDK